MNTDKLFREQSDLEDTLTQLWEERSAWYESGLARQWRTRARWAIGELRSVRERIAASATSRFWSYVIVG